MLDNEEKSPKINAAKKAITQSTKNRQKLQLVSSDEEAFDEKIGKELQDESFRETSPVAIQRRKNRSQDSNKSSAVKLIGSS